MVARRIPGYADRYLVDEFGRVSILDDKGLRVAKVHIGSGGYPRVGIVREDGTRVNESVHRLVALAFGVAASNQVVRHLDDVKTNNSVFNLRGGTQAENIADSIRNGTHRARRGLEHHNGRKTHCKRGHEFSEENTRIQVRQGQQRRSCKTCVRLGR